MAQPQPGARLLGVAGDNPISVKVRGNRFQVIIEQINNSYDNKAADPPPRNRARKDLSFISRDEFALPEMAKPRPAPPSRPRRKGGVRPTRSNDGDAYVEALQLKVYAGVEKARGRVPGYATFAGASACSASGKRGPPDCGETQARKAKGEGGSASRLAPPAGRGPARRAGRDEAPRRDSYSTSR